MTPAMLTNDELDLAIADAESARDDAWAAQVQATVEEGYTSDQAQAAMLQALEAEAYFRGLVAERQRRESIRQQMAGLILELGATALRSCNAGPWSLGFYGTDRYHRSNRMTAFLRAHDMPYQQIYYPSCVVVTFWRHNHILQASFPAREITPKSPPLPADFIWEGGHAHVQTEGLAL